MRSVGDGGLGAPCPGTPKPGGGQLVITRELLAWGCHGQGWGHPSKNVSKELRRENYVHSCNSSVS